MKDYLPLSGDDGLEIDFKENVIQNAFDAAYDRHKGRVFVKFFLDVCILSL
jgi:hypothetical protein